MSTIKTIAGLIEQASTEDLYKPWIRISKSKRGSEFQNKDFVTIKANGRSVACQLRGTSDENSEKIEMSEHYRELLGWNSIPTEINKLELVRFKCAFLGILKTIHYHPDDLVRFSIGLGATGISIALVNLLIAVLRSLNQSTFWFVVGLCVIDALFIGFLIGLAVSLLRPLRR